MEQAMETTVDVAIIGAGTSGLAALREVRKRTDSFVLINDGPYGTTCARVGCMPSKALIEAANAFQRRRDLEEFGIRGAEALGADIPAVLERVRSLRDGFVAGVLKATDPLGERNIAGRACLLGPERIRVADREIRARRIIIATGSRSLVPGSWQQPGNRILTSDNIFEQHDLPPRIAVVGLGAIGVEMAQSLSRLGIEIHAFGAAASLAGITDPAVAMALESALGAEVRLHLGARAEPAAVSNGIQVASGELTVAVDAVLAALGRRPGIDGLGLESLGVPLDERGMPPVDPCTLQIGDLPVFLAGDANGRAKVLHEAADEGYIAGVNAVSDQPRRFRRRTPLAIVFSDPTVALVGKPFRDLDLAETLVGEVDFSRQGRARVARRDRGVLRVYARADNGLIQGAEMCAPAGEHFAHLLALAVDRSLGVRDLLAMPFYHPVLEEGLRTALRSIASRLPGGSGSDLATCDPFGAEALD